MANVTAWVNTALALATATALGSGVLAGHRPAGLGMFGDRVLDVVIFFLVWCYTLLTPVIAFISIMLGRRDTTAARITYFLIALWIIYVAWTLTLTFLW